VNVSSEERQRDGTRRSKKTGFDQTHIRHLHLPHLIHAPKLLGSPFSRPSLSSGIYLPALQGLEAI
jgi:hypothetical protein